jgi:hypothetical protein
MPAPKRKRRYTRFARTHGLPHTYRILRPAVRYGLPGDGLYVQRWLRFRSLWWRIPGKPKRWR